MANTTTEKKYAVLQLPADVHEKLKTYCKSMGFNMSGFVSNLIKKELKTRG
jgi:hypothetical protein